MRQRRDEKREGGAERRDGRVKDEERRGRGIERQKKKGLKHVDVRRQDERRGRGRGRGGMKKSGVTRRKR